jgi:hypothetical protein
MLKRFVCLANSFKEGGRCLAGILLDANCKPIFENEKPKWIRPICNTTHGEIYTNLVSHIKILDIIEIEITNYPKVNNYQSENVYFRENSIRIIGEFQINQLDNLIDNRNLIFGNRGKAVSEEAIVNLTFSLMFVKINQYEVIEKKYEDNPKKSQIRLVFSYNKNKYDLPITDPVFMHNYQKNPSFFEIFNQLYITLPLGVEWQGWFYKLVAGMILIKDCELIEDDSPF